MPEDKRRLNVILIAPLFPPMPGGGSTQPYYLARALGARPGLRVHVVAPEPPLGDKHWLDPRRVTVHRVKPGIDLGKVPLSTFLERSLRVYARITSEPGFSEHETLIVHGQHWAGVFVAMHLKHRFGVPMVATLHKTPIGEALGEITKDTDPVYCHFTWLATWPVDAFVAGSRFFESELCTLVPGARVELIPHGVPAGWLRGKSTADARHRAWAKLQLDPDTELVVCPVRWDPRKRVPDFVAAAGRLSAEFPSKKLKFLITADITRDERDELIQTAAKAGIADALLAQSLDFEDVPAIFRSAKMLVVPTDREGLGISVLEAMALERPVVATDVEGIREIVKHEINGYRYAAGEATHLAQIMAKLLRDSQHASTLATAGYGTVRYAFSDVSMADRHEDLYRSLIASAQ